jgi:adenosylhomocysteine nucleosidase
MRIGLICATPEEFAAIKTALPFSPSPEIHARFEFWRGRSAGQDLVLVRSGIGKVNAAAVTTILLEAFQCGTLVFSGVAGGLDLDLRTGDVILGERVAAHDYGITTAGVFTSVAEGTFPIGAAPLRQSHIASAAPAILEHLEAVADAAAAVLRRRVALGTILTGDTFVNCATTRDRLRIDLGGDAVDMESSAVVAVAERYGCDAFIIRTISDNADESSHVSYLELVAMAAENSATCVTLLLERLRAEAGQGA